MADEVPAETEQPEFKKGNKEKFLRIGAIVLIVATVFVLILIKINNPELSTVWIILPGGIVLIIALIGLFWNKVHEKLFAKKTLEEKIPGAISQADAFKIVKEFVESDVFENHIKQYEAIEPYNYGKNVIYEFRCILLYEDSVQKGVLSIFINANHPNKIPAYRFNLSDIQAKRRANRMSESPIDEPDITEITETKRDPLTGEIISREVKKRGRKKEIKKTEKEET